MMKTIRHFTLLCCLTLFACFSVFIPSYAQAERLEVPGIQGPCSPSVFAQLSDIAELKAYQEKVVMERATDESNDPSIMSLSCFEGDITKMLDAAEGIIKSASSGINLNSLVSFYNDNKNQIKNEISAAAGKFACENIKAYVQNQLDSCFNFRLIEKQSLGRLGNQACLINANANVTINRHGYAYTGISASGSISGPGGFEESVLLGGDIVDGLESLYSNWNDAGSGYQSQGPNCGQLDPNITSTHNSTYYSGLDVGELPDGVTSSGNDYTYNTVGTYTVTSNGVTQQIPYENNAACYGFTPSLPYAPCGLEDDGTPAPCGNADGFDPSCCNIETTDCSRSGLDTICPCNQGNLLAALEVTTDADGNNVYTPLTDPATGGPACNVGVPTCCNGDLNDCTLPQHAPYEYCPGTEPEPEVPIDCDAEFSDIVNSLQLTPEQVVEQCPQDFVQELRDEIRDNCESRDGIGTGCKDQPLCSRSGFNCYVNQGKATQHIAQQCQVFVSNQDIIDNIDPELLDACNFDFDELGPYITPSTGDDDGGSTGGGGTGGGGGGGTGGGGTENDEILPDNNLQTAPTAAPRVSVPITTPTPTPTPTPAQSTTTPSAGSGGSTGGGTTGGNGSIPSGLF